MAIALDCRIDRSAAGLVIALPHARAERAYMLLDALMCGTLREAAFRSGGVLLACRCGEADILVENALTLSRATADHVMLCCFRLRCARRRRNGCTRMWRPLAAMWSSA